MEQTKFNLCSLSDMCMKLDEAQMYITSFKFNRETGYEFKVSGNKKQECIRFDFAELQDILTDWVSEIVVMNDHVIFVTEQNIYEDVDAYTTDDDGEFIIVRANNDIYLLYPKHPKVHNFSATDIFKARHTAQDALMKLVKLVGQDFNVDKLAEDYKPKFTTEECVYINSTIRRIEFHLDEPEILDVITTTKEQMSS